MLFKSKFAEIIHQKLKRSAKLLNSCVEAAIKAGFIHSSVSYEPHHIIQCDLNHLFIF